MPRSDDRSPGDGRQPYSDIGGVAARHAETHDVRREELTNPTGPDRSAEEFAEDLVPATPANELHTHSEDSTAATDDKDLHAQLPELTNDVLGRLSIVNTGTRLEQGGTYLDLNAREQGPFTALGGQEAEANNRYVAKKDTDYELWNILVGEER
ncbi:MAG TPA: hypothetical protein VIL85_04360 [Thermomicrobiales bacterium]|jgi:hypothetical protein